jgi:hypothetical protein
VEHRYANQRVLNRAEFDKRHALVIGLLVKQSGHLSLLDLLHGSVLVEDVRHLSLGVDLAGDVRQVQRL